MCLINYQTSRNIRSHSRMITFSYFAAPDYSIKSIPIKTDYTKLGWLFDKSKTWRKYRHRVKARSFVNCGISQQIPLGTINRFIYWYPLGDQCRICLSGTAWSMNHHNKCWLHPVITKIRGSSNRYDAYIVQPLRDAVVHHFRREWSCFWTKQKRGRVPSAWCAGFCADQADSPTYFAQIYLQITDTCLLLNSKDAIQKKGRQSPLQKRWFWLNYVNHNGCFKWLNLNLIIMAIWFWPVVLMLYIDRSRTLLFPWCQT